MPVSKNRTSVQSKANLPSGVDSRIRKGVCRSCHSKRCVKTSDSFSIADTAGCPRAYSSGNSGRPKELDMTHRGALAFSNWRKTTAGKVPGRTHRLRLYNRSEARRLAHDSTHTPQP